MEPDVAFESVGRSPHGERGLKLQASRIHHPESLSLSSRRAWIEILGRHKGCDGVMSLSSRRAWIEIIRHMPLTVQVKSLSSRRAWIEINT